MRDLVIKRLESLIKDSGGEGIPAWIDCDEDEMITDPAELATMTDEELLEAFQVTVGFNG